MSSNQNFVQRQESVYGNYRVCISWVVGLKVDAQGIRGDEILCGCLPRVRSNERRKDGCRTEKDIGVRYHDFHLFFERKVEKYTQT